MAGTEPGTEVAAVDWERTFDAVVRPEDVGGGVYVVLAVFSELADPLALATMAAQFLSWPPLENFLLVLPFSARLRKKSVDSVSKNMC